MKKASAIIIIILIAFCLSASGSKEKNVQDGFRIVSLSPNVTKVVCALGATENLVGRSDYCTEPEEVKSICSIGTLYDPNIELIISLHPDVVLASSITDPYVIEKLNKAGIESHQFLEEYNGMEGTFNLIMQVGQAIGKETEAQAFVRKSKEELADLKEKLSSISNKKSCVVLIGWGSQGNWGATGDTFVNDMIEYAGGINSASNARFWSVTDELLISSDPDVIFISSDLSSQEFIKTQPYSELTASKKNNVFSIDKNICQLQGIDSIEGVITIAHFLYPEII